MVGIQGFFLKLAVAILVTILLFHRDLLSGTTHLSVSPETAPPSAWNAPVQPNCSPANPCNTITYNPACPQAWMNHPFGDSYERDDGLTPGAKQAVCDYKGEVTQAECDAEHAMSTAGSHGNWCQKFINNNTALLSLVRKN